MAFLAPLLGGGIGSAAAGAGMASAAAPASAVAPAAAVFGPAAPLAAPTGLMASISSAPAAGVAAPAVLAAPSQGGGLLATLESFSQDINNLEKIGNIGGPRRGPSGVSISSIDSGKGIQAPNFDFNRFLKGA